MRRTLQKLAGTAGGLTLVVIRVPVFITPVPFGLPLIALGPLLLLRTWSWARLLRRRLHRRCPEIARRLAAARMVLPGLLWQIRTTPFAWWGRSH